MSEVHAIEVTRRGRGAADGALIGTGAGVLAGAGLGAAIGALEGTSGRQCIWATSQYLSYARPDEVLDEANRLKEDGVKELLVVAQDTSAYGIDCKYQTVEWQGKNLKTLAENSTRIATALEAIAARMEAPTAAALSPEALTPPAAPAAAQIPEPPKQPVADAAVPTPPAASPAATVPAAPTVASPSEVPAPPAAPAATVTMTPEQLNAALVEEFKRLGSRDGIDAALKEMGVSGVQELPAEKYGELLAKVKAL